MKKTLAIFLLICAVAGAFAAPGDGAVDFLDNLEEAKAKAAKEKKPLFIDFFAAWASPCQTMENKVFTDPVLSAFINSNFVPVKIDVKSDEGKAIVKKYGVKSYAYYLIADKDGNVVQPISGGARAGEFQKRLQLGLDKKKNYAAAKKRMEAPGAKAQDIADYLAAAKVAGDNNGFAELRTRYMGMLPEKDFFKREVWDILSTDRERGTRFHSYVTAHRPEAVKAVGETDVVKYLERTMAKDVLHFATSDGLPDNDVKLLAEEMVKAQLPDTTIVATVYNIGQLRRDRKFSELFGFMESHAGILAEQGPLRLSIEQSFVFPGLTTEERDVTIAYLNKCVEREKGSKRAQGKLTAVIDALTPSETGIEFSHGTFGEILDQAKREGKRVFVDCYTSWCGPCRVMARKVFTLPEVGEHFNKNFVSVKIDMEAGEGPELGKRYEVKAYPTMLVLDSNGKELTRIVGSVSGKELIEKTK